MRMTSDLKFEKEMSRLSSQVILLALANGLDESFPTSFLRCVLFLVSVLFSWGFSPPMTCCVILYLHVYHMLHYIVVLCNTQTCSSIFPYVPVMLIVLSIEQCVSVLCGP